MPNSLILVAHICAGIVGLLSGTAALSFRKGSPKHVRAGKVFVASMLTMAAGAAYLAIVKHQSNNFGGGVFTFYLILTAWLTARLRYMETNRLDWVLLVVPLTLGILAWNSGIKALRAHEDLNSKFDNDDLRTKENKINGCEFSGIEHDSRPSLALQILIAQSANCRKIAITLKMRPGNVIAECGK